MTGQSTDDTRTIMEAREGEVVSLGGLGVVYKVTGRDSGGAYAIGLVLMTGGLAPIT